MEGAFHFEAVTAARSSQDGEHVLIKTMGRDGSAWLSLPAEDVPRAVAALLQAAGQATETRGKSITHRVTELHQMKLQDIPGDPQNTLLLMSLIPGAPPIAFRTNKGLLAQAALGILQSMGVIPDGRPPGPTQ